MKWYLFLSFVALCYIHALSAMQGPYFLFTSSDLKISQKLAKEIQSQQNLIQDLSKEISEDELDELTVLRLYNERGIAYFFLGQFEASLCDFNHVLQALSSSNNLKKTLLGTALWGRLLCHAFTNQEQATYQDSLMIQLLFSDCDCEKKDVQNSIIPSTNASAYPKNTFSIMPIANFSFPQEKISKSECCDRARGIADKMRSLADLIPTTVVRWTVIQVINLSEEKAVTCCKQGIPWTECLNPIADAWIKLRDMWDELTDLFNRGFNIGSILTS